MKPLVCTICNGSLIAQEGGMMFACEYCGTKYPNDLVKKMLVKVEGVVSEENLLIRAREFWEEGNYQKAQEYGERILDLNPSSEEGRHFAAGPPSILLRSCGLKKIEVIKLIRELTGLGLPDAKFLAEHTPCKIEATELNVAGYTLESAAAALERLGCSVQIA